MSHSGTQNDLNKNQGQRPNNPNSGNANSGNANSASTFANAKDAVTDKAKEVTNRVSEFAGQATDKAKEVSGQVGEKVTEIAGQAKDKAQEWASDAGEAMTYAKDRAQEWATEAAEKTGATVKDLGNELTDLIRRYPAPALLIGFGLGFMIAKASSTSRH